MTEQKKLKFFAKKETELQRANRLNEEKLKNDPVGNLMAQKMVENLNRNVEKDHQA